MLLLFSLLFNGSISVTPTPPTPPIVIESGGQHVGNGSLSRDDTYDEYYIEREKKLRILKDDDEVLSIIKMWLKCQE